MNVHELIDRFVASFAQSTGIFQPIIDAPWIAELERKLPKRLPASFRSLVTRYAFAPFVVGGLSFYANMGTDDEDEMGVAIFRDRLIAEPTLKAGYIQFARPVTGSYDPICFDAWGTLRNREFPILRLDHEEILRKDRIYVTEAVADSFSQFAACRVSRGFAERGYAKAAWNFSLAQQPSGDVVLRTETRVRCLDERSRRRFRLYWAVVGPFSGQIRREMSECIKQKAESPEARAA